MLILRTTAAALFSLILSFNLAIAAEKERVGDTDEKYPELMEVRKTAW